MGEENHEIVRLLERWSVGDGAAFDELVSLVHGELKKIVVARLSRDMERGILQPAALAHEACLRMMESDRVDWRIRAGFFAVAAESVRRILVDQARQRAQSPAILVAALPGRNIDILQLDDAIERLAAFDSKKAQVVELRYFGGLSAEECEELTGLSTPAVKREWAVAKAWLYRELRDEGDLGARTVA